MKVSLFLKPFYELILMAWVITGRELYFVADTPEVDGDTVTALLHIGHSFTSLQCQITGMTDLVDCEPLSSSESVDN